MRRLKIVHETRYEFSQAVKLHAHFLMVRPREGHDLHIEYLRLDISPQHHLRWQRDVYGNSVATVEFLESAQSLVCISEVVIQHYDDSPLDFMVADGAVNFPFQYDADTLPVLAPYRESAEADCSALRAWLARFWQPGLVIQTYTLLEHLCSGIHSSIRYQRRDEAGVQAPSLTLSIGSGSCRDLAWLFVAAVVISMTRLRSLRVEPRTPGPKFICLVPAGRDLIRRLAHWLEPIISLLPLRACRNPCHRCLAASLVVAACSPS